MLLSFEFKEDPTLPEPAAATWVEGLVWGKAES